MIPGVDDFEPRRLCRTKLLLGREKLEILQNSHVLVVGLGGVGAYAAETICRAGVGEITIVDGDSVEESNINRQLPALSSTVGKPKSEIMAARLRDINPDVILHPIHKFIRNEETEKLLAQDFDYVVDAIDTLFPKLNLIIEAYNRELPLVSSMGAGGKVDPGMVKLADISKSYNCRLAKALRKLLHRRGIRKGFEVVFSPEDIDPATVVAYNDEETGMSSSIVGTISYMPAVFGCFCAFAVIRGLLQELRAGGAPERPQCSPGA
jgi:tRNA threonylcarbamoyladenosine dehydratase